MNMTMPILETLSSSDELMPLFYLMQSSNKYKNVKSAYTLTAYFTSKNLEVKKKDRYTHTHLYTHIQHTHTLICQNIFISKKLISAHH